MWCQFCNSILLDKLMVSLQSKMWCWCFQIFTNADKGHAAEVLKRLGLEDCFEGVICFETLNPPVETNYTDALDNDAVLAGGEVELNVLDDDADKESSHSKPRILCKPSLEAVEAAIQIANVDPKKTVGLKTSLYLSCWTSLLNFTINASFSFSDLLWWQC